MRGFARSVLATASVNMTLTVASGAAGIVIARSLGPATRGHYAALQAWLEALVAIAALGQFAATTYSVARDPERARDHLATARAIMLLSGLVVLVAGLSAAPLLARGEPQLIWAYRMLFVLVLINLAGGAYLFTLMAANPRDWNITRLAQPLMFLAIIAVLQTIQRLSLTTVLFALLATIAGQGALALVMCSRHGYTGGRCDRSLARPMMRYGLAHLASAAPALVSGRVDQMVLSMTAAPAVLGYYAVAGSLTTLATPVVAALGFVAFPRLASRQLKASEADRMRRSAILLSVGIGLAAVSTAVLTAPWLVPMVFGASYRGAVPFVWLLAPGAVCTACASVCGDLLRGQGSPIRVARAQAIAAGCAIALLAVLVPGFRAYGAAIATSAGQVIALAMMLRDLLRRSAGGPTPVESATSPKEEVPA